MSICSMSDSVSLVITLSCYFSDFIIVSEFCTRVCKISKSMSLFLISISFAIFFITFWKSIRCFKSNEHLLDIGFQEFGHNQSSILSSHISRIFCNNLSRQWNAAYCLTNIRCHSLWHFVYCHNLWQFVCHR